MSARNTTPRPKQRSRDENNDLIRIANDTQPEELLIHIRQRAEHEFKETIDRLRAQQAETPV